MVDYITDRIPRRSRTSARSPKTPPPQPIDEMISALRTIPHGGIDDNARHLTLSPHIRASISPVLNAMRWSAVLYGMIFGIANTLAGRFEAVVSVTVCLFLTVWRTMLPIKLGSPGRRDKITAVSDAALFGAGVGYSGGALSPYAFCLTVAVAVAAFGWGYRVLLWSALAGSATMALTWSLSTFENPAQGVVSSVAAFVLVTGLLTLGAAFLRNRLVDSEHRRIRLAGRVETLSETNELLTMLNAVARTLPTSLNQREALENARDQIVSTFNASVICLLEFDETNGEWVPKLVEGCGMKPYSTADDLPVHLRQALDSDGPWLVSNLTEGSLPGINPRSGSGIYTKLKARGNVVGVLGIEHQVVRKYRDRESRLIGGLADVIALTLDNARWFGRLRSLGAEEERIRIARDLHDRLGQWLTYISFELERIITEDGGEIPELGSLYTDVQTALDELRETLRQLRSGISEERPFEVVASELAHRFEERTDVAVSFEVKNRGAHLSVPVETEFLRIMQEALNNVDKHAKATQVDIVWNVSDGTGSLTVRDNGRGFDAKQSVRDSAYGLVGMRERADVVGARLTIDSSPGEGTMIVVVAGTTAGRPEGTKL